MIKFGRSAQGMALVVLVFACFLPGLSGGFIFDDYPNIVQQPALHVTTLGVDELKQASGIFGLGAGRSLPLVSFALDHAMFGLDPGAFKRTNVLLHAINALLMLALLSKLLAAAGATSSRAALAPAAIAALWALHPLQVSTVLYVVQRMEIMSLSFVLAGLVCYVHGRCRQADGRRGWPWLLGSVVAMLAGIACKENAVLMPVYALALELTVLRFRHANAALSRLIKFAYLAMVIAGAVVFILLIPHFAAPEVYAIRNYTALERVLTQFRALPQYIGWILLPQPSKYLFYYDNFEASRGLLSPWTTAAGLAFLASMFAAAFAALRRAPIFSLGVFWFLGAHLITSSYLPLELVFEHRNYFAIVGLLLAGYDLARRIPYRSEPRLATVAVVVMVVGIGLLCAIRSANWGNPMQLALELAERNPGSSRASTDLGEQYMIRAGNDPTSRYYDLALEEFKRGAAFPGSSALPEQGLIVLAASSGQPAQADWWDSAINKLRTRAVGPQELSLVVGLLSLSQQGYPIDDRRLAEAYTVLVERTSLPAVQYYAFGKHAIEKAGDPQLADKLLKLAVDGSDGNQELVQDITRALVADGHPELAAMVAAYAKDTAGMDVILPTVLDSPAQ